MATLSSLCSLPQLSLRRSVYQALTSLDLSKADAATRYYVQRQLLKFRLAGVDKDDATRAKLKRPRDQLIEEESVFERNIADDQRTIEVTNISEMDGLPQDFIDNHKPGADGKIRIMADDANFLVMKVTKHEGLRRRFREAYWRSRAYPKNREVLQRMLRSRSEIATLLGYSSWADYNAADKMIGGGRNVAKFIEQLDVASRPVAEREFAMLLTEKRKTNPEATEIAAYDYDSWGWSAARSSTSIREPVLVHHDNRAEIATVWASPGGKQDAAREVVPVKERFARHGNTLLRRRAGVPVHATIGPRYKTFKNSSQRPSASPQRSRQRAGWPPPAATSHAGRP